MGTGTDASITNYLNDASTIQIEGLRLFHMRGTKPHSFPESEAPSANRSYNHHLLLALKEMKEKALFWR